MTKKTSTILSMTLSREIDQNILSSLVSRGINGYQGLVERRKDRQKTDEQSDDLRTVGWP